MTMATVALIQHQLVFPGVSLRAREVELIRILDTRSFSRRQDTTCPSKWRGPVVTRHTHCRVTDHEQGRVT